MANYLRLITIAAVTCLGSPWQTGGKNNEINSLSRNKAPLLIRNLSTIPAKLLPVATKISMSHDDDQERGSEIESCLYKTSVGWKQRIQLNELKVGQKIIGEKIAGTDLLGGKTGPKCE